MDIHEAKTLIDQGNVTIVDIRDPGSYAEARIAEAIHLRDENVDAFLKETNKERPVLCYCYHGNSSQQAAAFLQEHGFKTVYSMDGGFEAWRNIYSIITV